MNINLKSIIYLSFSFLFLMGCASKRKKNQDPSTLGKFYHNTTAYYNGYFNANELLEGSYATLRAAHQDNFNEILPLYDFMSIDDPKVVAADLDKAIEKVTTVASLHEPSKWVDDCYVMMGEAQFLKQEYESAEETFAYFKEEFNPGNPFGRNYSKKKKSKKAIKKERDNERKEEQKKKEEEKEAKEKATKKAREEKEKEKKEAEKERQEARDQQKKEREAAKKQQEKDRKKKKSGGKKQRPAKEPKEDAPTSKDSVIDPTQPEKETGSPDEPIAPTTTSVKEEVKKSTETDEETEDKKKEDKKVKEDKTAYSKGMTWYAKTLVRREKYSNASYIINRMKSEGTAPKDVQREFPVILADIAIQEKNYPLAINYLDEAIDLSDEDRDKSRYAFVQGQLYLFNKNYAEANAAFDIAKRSAKSFKMEFMAEMNREKTDMFAGNKSKSAVVSKLDKMAKEAKYEEYKDQIYFTQGEIYLEESEFEKALESFSKSISNNKNNLPLKQETYHKLAGLFYDKEDYVDAKLYYDSTVMVLDKEDPRYNPSSRLAENLTEIAQNIQLITLQDSILGMVAWSDDKISKVAEKMVEEEKIARENAGKVEDKPTRKSDAIIDGKGGLFNTSSFFAYDPFLKLKGQKDFKNTWGDIPLEDDWRRQDKTGVYEADKIENSDPVAEDGYQEDELSKMIKLIKSQIPYGDVAQAEKHKQIENAYFVLGKSFRDKIQNYAKSVEAHESLLQKYPAFENKLEVYYYLFLNYLDLNNTSKSNFYKSKILEEYPDTEYAKSLNNPNYAATKMSSEEKLEKFYSETYALHEAGNHQAVLEKVTLSETAFGKENTLKPKFALLKAMAIGNTKGKEEYIKELRDIVTRYPNTEEKARADEMLRFLLGDDNAFSGMDIKEVDNIYTQEDDLLHYVVVVMYDVPNENLVNAKISISNYNKEFHSLKKLQLNDAPLDTEKNIEVILVRRFDNKQKSMEYYNEVIKSKEQFVPSELGAYAIYPISQRNYRKMLGERSDVAYRVFFETYYLAK